MRDLARDVADMEALLGLQCLAGCQNIQGIGRASGDGDPMLASRRRADDGRLCAPNVINHVEIEKREAAEIILKAVSKMR